MRTQGAGIRIKAAALGLLAGGLVLPGEAVEAQTLFPPLHRLQGGSPTPTLEKQEAPWRSVTPDQLFPDENAGSEGPIFDLDLLRQLDMSAGGGGLGSGQGEVIGPGSGQSGVRGSSPGSGVGTGQGSGDGTGLEAGSQRPQSQVTGLLVDARGLDFLPSQSMRLLDPDGNPVYPPINLGQDLNAAFVGSEGTAAYATSEEQARWLVNRIGERPHRIRALRTLGYDLVISAEDAFNLRQMNAADGFLDRFAVVVIWDGSQASLP
ncbi:hypothetical protein NW814_09955 [Synechococcus sp. R65.1]|uniref:hypothetical protein n=1 Tax=Synechococcus sp. R65.1 TaxID=2964524 RepID=UPI0039C1DA89